MFHSEVFKNHLDELIKKGLIVEARELLLSYFQELKANNTKSSTFINESNFFLDTVLKIVR